MAEAVLLFSREETSKYYGNFSFQTILTEEEKVAFKPISGQLKKGEASFHHALAVHGSYGNRLVDLKVKI